MALKFDIIKLKQQLILISVSLSTIVACMLYLNNQRNWAKLGKFKESILPFALIGEISKIAITKYFGRNDKDLLSQKHKRKSTHLSIHEILGGFLLQILCLLFFACICIILGAPVLQSYEQTLVLASLLTIMTVSPVVLLFGGSGALQVCFCEKLDYLTKSEETALELHKYHLTGVIFGAWAGSVVAPLDWDRDWQDYPIPNILGGLFGCGLLHLYACLKIVLTTSKILFKKRL